MSRELSDKFWSDDPYILLNPDRINEFIPSEDQTNAEKLNSITRFSIITSIILSLYKQSFSPYIIVIVVCVITFLVFEFSKDKKNKLTEKMTSNPSECVRPTKDNPFMNVLLSDYIDNPERGPACKYYDESEDSLEVKKDIKKNFEYNLYSDFEDMFGRKNSERNFYTMPATTIPSDRESFQNWLYARGPTCHEDNKACVQNIYEPVQGKPIFFQEIAKTA